MHDRVDSTVLRLERACDSGEIVGLGDREIERQDRRLWMSRVDNPIVKRLELADDPPVKHDRRALGRAAHGQDRAKSAACAGDEYDAVGERFRRLRYRIRHGVGAAREGCRS